MFFSKRSSRNSKITSNRQTGSSGGHRDRRLTLEHLENRALLSASPVAAQLAGGYSPPGQYGYGNGYSRTSTVATQYVVIAPPAVQSGVQTTIELVAVGANGRAATSYTGTANLTSTDSSTAAVIPATATFKNGVALVQVTLATAGDETITAKDSSTATIAGSATIDVLAPDVATQYYVAIKPIVQAGVATSVEFVALDANGYVVKNYDGTASLTSTDTGATFSSSSYSTVTVSGSTSTVTFKNGVAVVNVTFATAGSQTITATDSSSSSTFSTTSPSFDVVAPDEPKLFYVAVKSTVQSGVQTTVQLEALDAFGNLVKSYDGTVSLSDSGGSATFSSSSSSTVTVAGGVPPSRSRMAWPRST